MCLSLAGRIDRIEGDGAVVDVDGRPRRISLAVLLLEGTPVAPGDWVLVHTGLAVSLLDPAEAAEITRLRREMAGEGEESP
ncbi:MAG TPA: HypC/HybG/HupF family hydrogenase formation chaperone [Acidimicrobiales bacterium]